MLRKRLFHIKPRIKPNNCQFLFSVKWKGTLDQIGTVHPRLPDIQRTSASTWASTKYIRPKVKNLESNKGTIVTMATKFICLSKQHNDFIKSIKETISKLISF